MVEGFMMVILMVKVVGRVAKLGQAERGTAGNRYRDATT